MKKIVIISALLLILGGCSPTKNYNAINQTVISSKAKTFLNKAATTSGDEQHNYQLLAVDQLLADNNINDAEQLLSLMNTTQLNPGNLQQKRILSAELALKQNKPKTAEKILHQISNLKSLPNYSQIAYYSTAVQAHLRNNDLAYSTLARISLNSVLTDQDEIQQNRALIWHDLQLLSLDKLNQLANRVSAPLFQGWLQLAIITNKYANEPNVLASTIQAWQLNYPNHPANTILPDADTLQKAAQKDFPTTIALLLPLHGPFGKMGEAVKDGFMTAFYKYSKTWPQIPSIKIYDTSQNSSVDHLYKQAINAGANYVIGPLTKENVKALFNYGNISVPTLALNYVDSWRNPPANFIQFGLMPEQAAKQAAEKAWRENIHAIVVIKSPADISDRIANAFASRFQELGGTIVSTLAIDNSLPLSPQIASMLNIDQSQNRTEELANIFNAKIKTVFRRREDINGFFLALDANLARQIHPLLRYYYAGDLPLIATPNIYDDFENSRLNQDLSGIQFNDMPWLLAPDDKITALKNQIKSLWPANYRNNNRLYALGVDAYQLSNLFTRLMLLPNMAVHGVTGDLFLNAKQQINKNLVWGKFVNGLTQ